MYFKFYWRYRCLWLLQDIPQRQMNFQNCMKKALRLVNFLFLKFFDFHEMYMLLNDKIVQLFNLIIIYRENAEITNKTEKRERWTSERN